MTANRFGVIPVKRRVLLWQMDGEGKRNLAIFTSVLQKIQKSEKPKACASLPNLTCSDPPLLLQDNLGIS